MTATSKGQPALGGWNYRVFSRQVPTGEGDTEPEFFIGEAYYDDAGAVVAWTGPRRGHWAGHRRVGTRRAAEDVERARQAAARLRRRATCAGQIVSAPTPPYKLLWPPVYTGYPLCPDAACEHPFGDHFDQPHGGCSVDGCRCEVDQGAVWDAMDLWRAATGEDWQEDRPWRVGRKVGRTIYDRTNTLIGVMDTPSLAAQVVAAVNALTGGSAPIPAEATGSNAETGQARDG